ncbi:MAG: aldehyde dehydrogenase family protein [Puniceicoccaceae bacterium]|nr:MAG: aldehyde dehydrogenase family protein [Puniceicoccaceae bacterium]
MSGPESLPGARIAGREVPGSGPRVDVGCPWTGERRLSFNSAGRREVEAAVEAARRAALPWAGRPLDERIQILERYAEAVRAEFGALAGLISEDTGKPLWESRQEAEAIAGKVALAVEGHRLRCAEREASGVRTTFRPHGVLAVMGPFNFPGHLPNGQIVPALLAGNTVVFKPSELAPRTGRRLVELLEAAGLPPGAINGVQGSAETGRLLAEDEGIDGLFFTGSARTGEALQRLFAERPGKILALEMGGNNPLVVHDPADPAAAVHLATVSAFLSAGQRCTCARRLILVDGPMAGPVLEGLVERAGRLRVGPPDEQPEPFMGPVINARSAERLLRVQEDLRAGGGVVLRALRHLKPGTGLLSPGIVDVTGVSPVPDEEHFGPLLQVVRVATFEDALAEANRTRFGLAAGYIGQSETAWRRFQAVVKAGVLSWNRPLTGASGAAPFGGVGRSGNFRPGGLYMADACVIPTASQASPTATVPETPPPGWD